jgi:hypothetical protein
MPTEIRHFDESWCDGVTLRDGKPVQYWSLAKPRSKEEEPALAERIFALTGFRVRFGEWVEVMGDPRDGGAEVELFVVE